MKKLALILLSASICQTRAFFPQRVALLAKKALMQPALRTKVTKRNTVGPGGDKNFYKDAVTGGLMVLSGTAAFVNYSQGWTPVKNFVKDENILKK